MSNKVLLNLTFLTCMTGIAGCGLGADTLWEVSRLDGARPSSCYPNGKPPTTTTTQMGVQTNVGPWELYEGPESKMYLVLADKKTVIEGTKGDGFTFQWSITEVDTAPPQGMGTLTDAIANNLQFKVNGDTLTGTMEVKETHSCSGSLCGGLTLEPNCTVTHQVRGRKLDADQYKVY